MCDLRSTRVPRIRGPYAASRLSQSVWSSWYYYKHATVHLQPRQSGASGGLCGATCEVELAVLFGIDEADAAGRVELHGPLARCRGLGVADDEDPTESATAMMGSLWSGIAAEGGEACAEEAGFVSGMKSQEAGLRGKG